ncbi:Alpha/beta hydrolase family protein [compost metagenome]
MDAGFLVVILKTPLNLSLLDGRQALGVITEHPGVTNWAVGGHSLGGVSASTFALDHSAVSGLLLYCSYPLESLRDRAGLKVLSISGTEDGLSTPAKIDASREYCPSMLPSSRFRAGIMRSLEATARGRVTAKRRWTARWRKSRFLPPRWRS